MFLGCVSMVADKKVVPGVPAAEAYGEIFLSQTQRTEGVNQEGDQFGVGCRVLFPDNVRI